MQRANIKKSFYIENENDEAIFQYSAEEIIMAEKSGRILDGISAFMQAIVAQKLMRG